MIFGDIQKNSNIWLYNRKQECHFSRMINPVFKYEIFRIFSIKKSRKSFYKHPNPKKWICIWSFYSKNSERKSKLPIIIVRRHIDRVAVERTQVVVGKVRNRRLADGSGNTNNKGAVSCNDATSKCTDARKEK